MQPKFLDKIDTTKYKIKLPGLVQLFSAFVIFVLQIVIIYYISTTLKDLSFLFLAGMQLISLFLAFFMVRKDRNPNYALSWSIILLVFPTFGWLMYLLWGRNAKFSESKKIVKNINKKIKPLYETNPDIIEDLANREKHRLIQANYLLNKGFSLYKNTKCTYYAQAKDQFEVLFNDLRAAKKYIFLEYFIVADGVIWEEMRNILIEKAKQGVEIRLLIDDVGSALKSPRNLINQMREYDIQVMIFNPVFRYISQLYLNYRNHQKITIVDGEIAHTGGFNLADEYANIVTRFGHWKDTGIRLTGDAVWGMTSTFLVLWELEKTMISKKNKRLKNSPHSLTDQDKKRENIFLKYMPSSLTISKSDSPSLGGEGFFIPYWDGPYNNPENPSEEMYASLINTAVSSIYITTPYFVVDDAMIKDLCQAAESGVEVNLIVPGIPDKKIVFLLTRSYFYRLLKSGVNVYEYTPGFIHSKTILVDDEHAITGSINFDFRSFNLHYENAVWIYNDPVIKFIKEDMLDTLAKSRKISYAEWQKRPFYKNILDPFLRLIAPFM